MKIHETRSRAHSSVDEEKIMTRKQKAEGNGLESEHSPKKAKNGNGNSSGKSRDEIGAEFERFCRVIRGHVSVQQMHGILRANGQDPPRSDDAVVVICQDLRFYGPLDTCTVCGCTLEFTGSKYWCKGTLSEWTTCIYSPRIRRGSRNRSNYPIPLKNLQFGM